MPAHEKRYRSCHVAVTTHGPIRSLAEARGCLPRRGEGWLTLGHGLRRFDPTAELEEGYLLEAEIALSARETFCLRHDAGQWRAWSWCEAPGDSHRAVDEVFLSSVEVAPGETPPAMRYTTYWELREDEGGVSVWCPLGARFGGWEG